MGKEFTSGFNYLKSAQGARRIPEPEGGQSANPVLELPSIFEEKEEAPTPFIKPEVADDKVAVETTYRHFSRVFTLWRPHESCGRCKTAIDSGHVILPQDAGDYACPHTQTSEYKEVIDRGLRGDSVITVRDHFNNPPPINSRCVYVEWMEADPEALRKLVKEAEAKKKNQVYPPDVDGAFAKDK